MYEDGSCYWCACVPLRTRFGEDGLGEPNELRNVVPWLLHRPGKDSLSNMCYNRILGWSNGKNSPLSSEVVRITIS